MDQERRSTYRDSRKPYQKGRRLGGYRREREYVPVSDSTAAEDLAQYVLTVLARDSSSIQFIREPIDERRLRLSVSCDPEHTGRLIGKGGKTISALRLLVKSAASRRGKKVDIDINSQGEEQHSDEY
ncbi:MAG: KH domain-containing protein [Candidatus Obscuribacterales bacterium]|nr:KH domain-containing protein [Candidatus Obscuribacterales bacterium]